VWSASERSSAGSTWATLETHRRTEGPKHGGGGRKAFRLPNSFAATMISGDRPTQAGASGGTGTIPERLFHYQRFCEPHLVSLLSTGKLKLSRPDSFNDPWDCRVHYRVPTEPDERKRLVAQLVEWHRKHFPLMSEAERNQRADEFIADPSKLGAAFADNEPKYYEAICNRYRVYCLTEKPDSPLMWSHYASSHTGICLEFDARKAPFTEAFPPFTGGLCKVQYRATYPAYEIIANGNFSALFTKSEDWSYEAEWRLIAEEQGLALSAWTLKTYNDFLTLPSGVLTSVTIGCRADASSRQRIDRLVSTNAPRVLVRQATLAPDRYELTISPPFR
jgi:hypothetical protein